VLDTKLEHTAVTEANKLGLPLVAVVDTNCDPDLVDYVIPGNDDAIRAGDLMCRVISDAVLEGHFIRQKKAEAAGVPDAKPAERTDEEQAAIDAAQAEARAQAAAEAAARESRLAAAAAEADDEASAEAPESSEAETAEPEPATEPESASDEVADEARAEADTSADDEAADTSGETVDQPADRHAALPDGSRPEGFPVKGNRDSMKFHQPGGTWYDKTVAEIWFATAEAAEAAGYSEAGK